MKTYSFFRGNLVEGILLQNTRRGLGLNLGQKIKGGKHKFIRLDPNNPPEIEDGSIFDAIVNEVVVQEPDTTLRKKKKVRRLIGRPLEKEDRRCLIHINTESVCQGRGRGFWKKVRGHPKDVTIAIHLNEQGHTCMDGLVIMSPGDLLRVESDETSFFLLCESQGVRKLSFDEWFSFLLGRNLANSGPRD